MWVAKAIIINLAESRSLIFRVFEFFKHHIDVQRQFRLLEAVYVRVIFQETTTSQCLWFIFFAIQIFNYWIYPIVWGLSSLGIPRTVPAGAFALHALVFKNLKADVMKFKRNRKEILTLIVTLFPPLVRDVINSSAKWPRNHESAAGSLETLEWRVGNGQFKTYFNLASAHPTVLQRYESNVLVGPGTMKICLDLIGSALAPVDAMRQNTYCINQTCRSDTH